MRFKGKLKNWNDDRGFGFIDPIQGGEEIFVHIKAFSRRSSRPQVNDLLWFETELGPGGKKRAKNVEFVRKTAGRNKLPHQQSAQRGTGTLVAVPGFVVLYVVVGIVWQPPLALAAIYVGASASPSLHTRKTSRQPSAMSGEPQRLRYTSWHLLVAGLGLCLLNSSCATNPGSPSSGRAFGLPLS